MRLHARLAVVRLELVVLTMSFAAVLVLFGNGIGIGRSAFESILDPMIRRWPSLLLLGFVLQLVVRLLRRESPLAWIRRFLAPGSLLDSTRAWLALSAMTCLYFWLKVSVPLVNRSLWDAELWAVDRLLHFGVSPSILVVELFSGSPLVVWMDYWYALWLTTVLATQAFVLFDPTRAKRIHFALSCVVLWLASACVYVLLPAVGPCFFVREVFDPVRDSMPGANLIQQSLWANYLRVVADRGVELVPARPFLAVAALPSVHVGAHVMFALWARRYAKSLVPFFAIATALTFVGSLLTGWHYAVDGYVGALLGWAAVRIADRWVAVPEPTLSESPGKDREGQPDRGRREEQTA